MTMKRLLLTLAVVMLSCSVFAQTQAELYDRFNEAISRYDIDGAAAVIDEWEKAYPGDAEIFALQANYHFQKAINEEIVMSDTEPDDGREYLLTKDSLGVQRYLYSEIRIDSTELKAAQAALTEGILNHPDRLDLRLGKITVHLYVDEHDLAVQEVKSALERSLKNQNRWTDTLDEPIETDGVSYLRECIQDYLSQLIEADDLASAEKMIDDCILSYPKDAVFLTDKGVLRFYADDLKGALKWFRKASKADPDDMLIMANIANIYEKMGNRKKALKYYSIIAESDDEEFAEIAKSAIQELTHQTTDTKN